MVAALMLAAPAQAQMRTLVLSTYGLNNDIFKKHVYEPFAKQCNCEIVLETGNAAERLAKLDARKANPNVDVVQITDFLALDASAKGLLQPIDHTKIRNLDQVYDFGRDPLRNKEAIAYTVYSVGLVVRTDKPSAAITSWKDLARPELKGRVMLANITGNQGLAQLFMVDRAWGGFAGDMATGFARLGEIKPNVVTYYTQTAQMTALFAQDEAWVAPVGRFGWQPEEDRQAARLGRAQGRAGRHDEHDEHRQGQQERRPRASTHRLLARQGGADRARQRARRLSDQPQRQAHARGGRGADLGPVADRLAGVHEARDGGARARGMGDAVEPDDRQVNDRSAARSSGGPRCAR
jgi:hypothetical protein